MARIRTIKPDFWTDEKLVECSPNARLFFIGMWNFADDAGNLQRSAKKLKMQIFPSDSFDCETLIAELLAQGVIVEYQVSGESYLHIKGFGKHQKIDKPTKSNIPQPKFDESSPSIRRAFDESSPSIRRAFDEDSTSPRRAFDESSPTEGKGREGSVMEGKGTKPHPYPSPQPEPVGEVKSEEPKSDYPLDNPDSPIFDLTRGWLALIEKTFGKQSARLAPAADDKIFAKRWIDDGLMITEIMLYLEGSLAKIKEKGGQPPSGLKYFDKFIRENLKRSPLASENTRNNPIKTDTFWKMRMTGFIKNNIWPDGAGAAPGRDGCDVPLEILREYGFLQ